MSFQDAHNDDERRSIDDRSESNAIDEPFDGRMFQIQLPLLFLRLATSLTASLLLDIVLVTRIRVSILLDIAFAQWYRCVFMRRGGFSCWEVVLEQFLPFVIRRGRNEMQSDEAKELDGTEREGYLQECVKEVLGLGCGRQTFLLYAWMNWPKRFDMTEMTAPWSVAVRIGPMPKDTL